MRVDNSVGKGKSGMDKFGSVIDRLDMKFGSKFLNSLRIKTQLLLKRLQRVIVVDDATHSQKDGVENNRVTELQIKPSVKTCNCICKTCLNCDSCCCSARIVTPTKINLEREKRHNVVCCL